jgi:hypothetical protein
VGRQTLAADRAFLSLFFFLLLQLVLRTSKNLYFHYWGFADNKARLDCLAFSLKNVHGWLPDYAGKENFWGCA